ncbi:hypothetical protein C8Q77DRAFT_409221 [Trametes polyzona]|nr:hypothetical protein C8Q77DRAFT_409221 [Trametes polyzona]
MPSLSTLPGDLQFKILCELDVRSLVACRRVCRSLSEITQSTLLQYRVALVRAGMADSAAPALDYPLAERLQNLLLHEQRWEHPVADPDPTQPWTNAATDVRKLRGSGGFIPYIEDDALILWQPSSELRGVRERRIVLRETAFRGCRVRDITACAIDPAQDLVAVNANVLDANLNHKGVCHLLSLSHAGSQHPSAANPALLSRITHIAGVQGDPLISFDDIQIHGEKVLWRTVGLSPKSAVQVWNWKTGEMIWASRTSHHHLRVIQAFFLDSESVIIVNDDSICLVYIGKRYLTDDTRHFAFPHYFGRHGGGFGVDGGVYMRLLLPLRVHRSSTRRAVLDSASSQLTAHLQRPTCASATDREGAAGFDMDPALTVLAIAWPKVPLRRENWVLIVPLSTILAQRARVFRALSTKFRPPLRHCEPVLTWEEWGPRGSRFVTTPGHTLQVASLGSRCVVASRFLAKNCASADIALTFVDMRPGVGLDPSPDGSHPAAQCDTADSEGRRFWMYRSKASREPTYTTVPYRIAYKELKLSGATNAVSLSLLPDLCLLDYHLVSTQASVRGLLCVGH